MLHMSRIKNILAIITMQLLFTAAAFAQDNNVAISGIVLGEDSTALVGANVFVMDSVENIFASAMCDTQGRFTLEVAPRSYTLGVSCIGYSIHAQSIEATSDKDIGTVVMHETSKELQTVVVQGRAMRVMMQQNGFSVDVSNINQNFNNAFDLLHCIPQVVIKGESLKVLGKDNVIVKIGNVLQRVETSELASILKGYDSKLISKVEVLRQPPLRYNPDGNTAMVILHTISAYQKYLGGLVGTELMKGTNYNFRYGGYGSLMYNNDHVFFSVSPSANSNGSYLKENTDYDYGSYRYNSLQPSKGKSDYWGVRSTLQWDYSKNGLFGITGGINKRTVDNDFMSFDRFTPSTSTNVDADNQNEISTRTPKKNLTAYLEQSLGNPQNKMWLESSYYDYTEKENASFASDRVADTKRFFTYTDADALHVRGMGVNNDYSIRLDTLDNNVLDFGAKFMHSKTSKSRSHDQWMLDSEAESFWQDNKFELKEYTIAPYISLTSQLTSKWWMRLGLITDVTWRKSGDATLNTTHTYTSCLPSLHTTYTISRSHQLQLTVNSSVTQPKYGQLNPFEWRVNQKCFSLGNTALSPERHYDIGIGYTYKGSLSVAGRIKSGSNIISPVTIVRSDESILIQPLNAQNSMAYGMEFSYWFDKLSWLAASVSGNCDYARFTSDNPLLKPVAESFQWSTNAYLEFVLNRNRTFTGYVSGSYEGRRKTTVSVIRPQGNFELGMTCYLLNRNMSVSLAGMNLLSSRYRGYSDRDGYKITFDNRYNYPTFYLSVSYKFFNAKDSSPRRSFSSNEAERRF